MNAVSVCVLFCFVFLFLCVADVNGLTARYCTTVGLCRDSLSHVSAASSPVTPPLSVSLGEGGGGVGGVGVYPFRDCDGGIIKSVYSYYKACVCTSPLAFIKLILCLWTLSALPARPFPVYIVSPIFQTAPKQNNPY